ncbi:MAG: hypothetical protein ABIO49_06015, partial [Dokdonella sp.]
VNGDLPHRVRANCDRPAKWYRRNAPGLSFDCVTKTTVKVVRELPFPWIFFSKAATALAWAMR